jgi:hypothetical protein
MAMARRTKNSVLWTKHLQVCVSDEVLQAFKAYAEETYEGNCSQAARLVLQTHLEEHGYLEKKAA